MKVVGLNLKIIIGSLWCEPSVGKKSLISFSDTVFGSSMQVLRDRFSPLTKISASSSFNKSPVVFFSPYTDEIINFLTGSMIFPSVLKSTACPSLYEQSNRQTIARYFLLITKDILSAMIIHHRIQETCFKFS